MYPKETIEMPTVDIVIYTIIDPASSNYREVVDEVKDIVGDAVEGDILLNRSETCRKPIILSLRRFSVKGQPVTYSLSTSYQLTLAPRCNFPRIHIAQVDNDVFIDHLFLCETNNLLKV